MVDTRLVGVTPLSDALGATDGRTLNGATQFQVAGGGAVASGLFQHVVLQPAAPTIGPAAGTFSAGVRFYDQDGVRYAPSSTGNLQVVSAVNQNGITYTPWTNAGNVTVTYDAPSGTYNVSWAGLTGSVLGDRLYVTLRHQLESGYVVDFGFGIEVRNVPSQTATNPRYAAPDFP